MDPFGMIGVAVGAVVGGVLVVGAVRGSRKRKRHEAVLERTTRLGLTEPVSLHPRIDEHACICTGACVEVCPEKDVLGMVDGKPKLINPTACIGHGECMRACPVEAVTLVIGSEKRGVDLPLLGADFQTNVPGLYIAGELGGMGLIHNAVNQGSQAMKAIGSSLKAGAATAGDAMDVIIVGAGPAGLSAALQAKALGLSYALLDQEQVGGAVRSFPRQKVVMTAPAQLAIYGKVHLRRTTKEALLELWDEVIKKTELSVETGVKVTEIKRPADPASTAQSEAGAGSVGAFTVETSQGTRRARRVLLAIGRRGSPRKLGVPGEAMEKVTYKLLEPEQYREKRCLVVGGGDAAVEAALALCREAGTTVTLCHRSPKFDRIKPANFDLLEEARKSGRLDVRVSTKPSEITAERVALEGPDGASQLDNDFVFVCAGGELPTAWLNKIGVEIKTVRGEALPSMQS